MALYIAKYNMKTDKYTIASTDSNKTTIATREHLINALNHGMIVHGAYNIQGNLTVVPKCKATLLLDALDVGMPLRYKINNMDWKHAILGAKNENSYGFLDEGTTFEFSTRYIYNNSDRIKISVVDIDPVSVMKIKEAHNIR